MIYKLMSVDDLRLLKEKVDCITVKFPKSDKLFVYEGDNLHQYGYNKLPLYQKDTGHLVETTVKELLVEMTYETYQLRQLQNDADYELALAVFEQYFDSPIDSEEGRFAYLLSLIIADYEAEHYPTAVSSTVDFIDHLLEERGLTWEDLNGSKPDLIYSSGEALREYVENEIIDIHDLRVLSHFFRLPVQAFIVGGYGA
jgi:antitoxin component HigA of HigAB toxin-antitoxin module